MSWRCKDILVKASMLNHKADISISTTQQLHFSGYMIRHPHHHHHDWSTSIQ